LVQKTPMPMMPLFFSSFLDVLAESILAILFS